MIEKLKWPVTEDIYGESNLDFYFQDLDGQYNSPHLSNLPHFLQGLLCNKMSYSIRKKVSFETVLLKYGAERSNAADERHN